MIHRRPAPKKAHSSRPGRRSKAEKKSILTDHGWPVVEELRAHPLRQPVDVGFEPYYQRAAGGDLAAILEYCEANRTSARLDASFYELLGRLATLRFYRAADQLLCDIERRESYPTAVDAARYRYEQLKPLCDQARHFAINERNDRSRIDLEELWRKYAFQPLQKVRFAKFAGDPDEERLQNEENARQQQIRRRAIEELLAWSQTEPRPRVTSQIDRFAGFHLLPKEIFLEVAKRQWDHKPQWKPSQVARRWAACFAGISESKLTHKNGRK